MYERSKGGRSQGTLQIACRMQQKLFPLVFAVCPRAAYGAGKLQDESDQHFEVP